MLNLLVSVGLFAGLIASAAVAVCVSIGFAVVIYRKSKTERSLEADVVRKELYVRETDLVIKIITEKAEGKEREALIEELRRLRATETLIDEIIRTEKTERGIADKAPKAQKKSAKPAPAKKTAQSPAPARPAGARPAPKPVQNGARPAPASPQAKPAEKNEDKPNA